MITLVVILCVVSVLSSAASVFTFIEFRQIRIEFLTSRDRFTAMYRKKENQQLGESDI